MDTDSIEIGDIFEDNDPRMLRCPIAGPGPAHQRRVKGEVMSRWWHKLKRAVHRLLYGPGKSGKGPGWEM